MVPYNNLLYHANNPRPISILLGFIRRVQNILDNKNAEQKQIYHWLQKTDAIQNNMTQ